MRGSPFRRRRWVQSKVRVADVFATPQGGQPEPRCQLSLLKGMHSSKTEDPPKVAEARMQLLQPDSSTKQRGGNRFHISHQPRSDGGSQECVSRPTRADNDHHRAQPLLNQDGDGPRGTPTTAVPAGRCRCCLFQNGSLKRPMAFYARVELFCSQGSTWKGL